MLRRACAGNLTGGGTSSKNILVKGALPIADEVLNSNRMIVGSC
jgi:hypothetical protein